MYSRTVAIIGGFLVLASGAGELYRQKPRSRSLQSTGQVFLGIYLICVVGQGAVGGRCLAGSELWARSAGLAPENCPGWQTWGEGLLPK